MEGVYRFVRQNNFLYTAGAQNFSILDPSTAQVAGVQKPVIVGSCMAPALCLAISGQYAYLGSENGKLHMIDISNPAKPVQLNLALKARQEAIVNQSTGRREYR